MAGRGHGSGYGSGFGSLKIEVDTSALQRLSKRFEGAADKAPMAMVHALNRTGAMAKTAMVRALPGQTGLKREVLQRALKPSRASLGRLTFEIKSYGGNVSLMHFGARETRPGVSAAPWNRRELFEHTFMKAGWWPKRVKKANWHGQVFERAGGATRTGMDRFNKVKSGLFIPDEMVRDESRAAFDQVAARELPRRLEHELSRLFK